MNELITGRTHYYAPADHIVMEVTITGSPSDEELEKAIQKAINKHEIFTKKVVLDKEGDSFYRKAAPRKIKLEIRDEPESDNLNQLIREQERIPFDFIDGELIRFFLYRNKRADKLVIVSSHLAGDGMSVIYLIRDIMTFLEKPEMES